MLTDGGDEHLKLLELGFSAAIGDDSTASTAAANLDSPNHTHA